MGFYDLVNFVVFDNPISKTVTSYVVGSKKSLPSGSSMTVITEKTPLWKLANEGGPFFRIAALMGASAVVIGAYGAHKTYPKGMETELKAVFETANKYHFYHSLALLGVPLCKNQKVAGSLLLTGTLIFSGSLYYYAFTGEKKLGKITPFGGTILILGWLSMAFIESGLLEKLKESL